MLVWGFFSRFIIGYLHISQKNAITKPKTSFILRKQAFHQLTLLCKCDSEHIAENNETTKRKSFLKKFSGPASVSLCRPTKRLMDMFIKTWTVALFGTTNSLFHILRSVKHPERKRVIW